QYKLVLLLLSRHLHQHVIRIDWLSFFFTLRVDPELIRNTPYVFTLKEHLRILCVIETVDFALSANECFRVTDVGTQVSGHVARVFKQSRKDLFIRVNDRILRVEYIKAS